MHKVIFHSQNISLHLLCIKFEAERSIYAMCNKKVSYENWSFKIIFLIMAKILEKKMGI